MAGFRTAVSNRGASLLPGGPDSKPMPTTDSFIYEAAQVEEIIGNEASDKASTQSRTSNIGRAKVRFENTGKGTNSDNLPWADPLLPHQSMFPLVGEYVLVFKMLGTYYYVGPINTKRQITENAHPIVGLLNSQPLGNILKNQRKTALGVLTQATINPNKVGTEFKKIKNANPLKPFEGDIIYQGRYGQSIRFGSSRMVGSSLGEQFPNIILRAGQGPDTAKTTDDKGERSLTNESINQDASSIYLVSQQILGLVPATYNTNVHLRSLLEKPVAFDGASILLNSDRLILNSKKTSIFMFSKKGIHLNSLEDGMTFDSQGPIILDTFNTLSISSNKTLEIESKDDAIISARKDVNVSGDRNVTIYGNEIFLGGRSSMASPIAMARPLKLFMFELLRTLMSTSPLTLGPSGLINPALIARLLIVYSKYMVLPDPFNPLWASNDNFVMKTNEQTLSGPGFMSPATSFKSSTGLGTRGPSEAAQFTKDEIDNAGLTQVRKLFDSELTAKL